MLEALMTYIAAMNPYYYFGGAFLFILLLPVIVNAIIRRRLRPRKSDKQHEEILRAAVAKSHTRQDAARKS